jgi:uncharacterized lipoprotein YbaY/uncharacterized membrane protein
MRIPPLLAMAMTATLGACQPGPKTAADPDPSTNVPAASVPTVIYGRATYLERIKMPPGADLVVQLVDNQLADAPQAVIASIRLDDVAGPPYEFSLPYDAAKVRPGGIYGLHANLHGPDGESWFVTNTRVPVTPGSSDVVEFRMVRVPGEGEAPPAANSPWDEAKSRGIVFRGVGNEPGWFVEVGQGNATTMRATLDYGERKLEVTGATPLSSTYGYGGKTADGTLVVLRIKRESCSDGMSDERYPASAELNVGEQAYRGCGRFLQE